MKFTEEIKKEIKTEDLVKKEFKIGIGEIMDLCYDALKDYNDTEVIGIDAKDKEEMDEDYTIFFTCFVSYALSMIIKNCGAEIDKHSTIGDFKDKVIITTGDELGDVMAKALLKVKQEKGGTLGDLYYFTTSLLLSRLLSSIVVEHLKGGDLLG